MNAPTPSPRGTARGRADRAADLLTDAVLSLNSGRLTRRTGSPGDLAALTQLALWAAEAAEATRAAYALALAEASDAP